MLGMKSLGKLQQEIGLAIQENQEDEYEKGYISALRSAELLVKKGVKESDLLRELDVANNIYSKTNLEIHRGVRDGFKRAIEVLS